MRRYRQEASCTYLSCKIALVLEEAFKVLSKCALQIDFVKFLWVCFIEPRTPTNHSQCGTLGSVEKTNNRPWHLFCFCVLSVQFPREAGRDREPIQMGDILQTLKDIHPSAMSRQTAWACDNIMCFNFLFGKWYPGKHFLGQANLSFPFNYAVLASGSNPSSQTNWLVAELNWWLFLFGSPESN